MKTTEKNYVPALVLDWISQYFVLNAEATDLKEEEEEEEEMWSQIYEWLLFIDSIWKTEKQILTHVNTHYWVAIRQINYWINAVFSYPDAFRPNVWTHTLCQNFRFSALFSLKIARGSCVSECFIILV